MKNGVVVDGLLYEIVKVEEAKCSKECDLYKKCLKANESYCSPFANLGREVIMRRVLSNQIDDKKEIIAKKSIY